MAFIQTVRTGARLGIATLLVALGSLVFAASASSEIYKWQDASGRLHFSQDLSQVPAQYRAAAEAGAQAPKSDRTIQHYNARVPAARAASPKPSTSSTTSGKTHRIRVSKSGNTMRVKVRLNGDIEVPFIIDTGASDVVVPHWAAEKMGLDLSGARTQYYRTANGTIESQVVTLETVQLGTAKASRVPASISRSMSVGLLGLTFFNHFRYNVDPVAGVVTLVENGLADSGRIRGGRSESQWRNQYRILASRRQAIERALDEGSGNRARRRAELEAAIDEVERQVRVLDGEADEARVPMRWRD